MQKLKSAVSAALRRYLGYQIIRTVPGGGYFGNWAGMQVTSNSALSISAVHRAVSYICDSIMCLPWQIFLAAPEGKRRVIGSTLEFILNSKANPELNADVWRSTMLQYTLVQGGNAYCEIARDEQGMAVGLGHPLTDSQVQLMRDEQSSELYCRVWLDQNRAGLPGGQHVDIWYRDMYHLRGQGNSFLGISVLRHAARSLGVGLALDQNAASFFGNGNRTTGNIEYPGVLSTEKKIELGNYIKDTLHGPEKSHNLLILDQGMKWASNTIPNDDAQFLQSRQFQVSEIARWFNVPVQKLMDYSQSPWGTAEQASIDAVMSGLMPWIHRMEIEANAKLGNPNTQGMLETKMNLMELLRADTKTRSEAYAKGRQWGYLSANEIRQVENMPSYDGGDVFLSPMNMERIEGGVQEPVFAGRARVRGGRTTQINSDGYLELCLHALGVEDRIEMKPDRIVAEQRPCTLQGISQEQALAGIERALRDQWETILTREAHELAKIKNEEKLDRWLTRHQLYIQIRLGSVTQILTSMDLVSSENEERINTLWEIEAFNRCHRISEQLENPENDKEALANQCVTAIIESNLLRGQNDDFSS